MADITGIQLSSGFVKNSKGELDKKSRLTTTLRLTLTEVQRAIGMLVYDTNLGNWYELINDPTGQDFTVSGDWSIFSSSSSVNNAQEHFVINATIILNGYIDLTNIPNNVNDLLIFYDGLSEDNGMFYTVSTNRISFVDASNDLYIGARIKVQYSY